MYAKRTCTTIGRVSNCVIRFLKQFEALRIEAVEIGNLLTKFLFLNAQSCLPCFQLFETLSGKLLLIKT